MKTHVIALGNDKQVARVVVRGTSVVLSMMQEETVDVELGVTYPAKSFTVDSLDGLRQLRDLLNGVLPA